jgi:minor extracellular protease Epr
MQDVPRSKSRSWRHCAARGLLALAVLDMMGLASGHLISATHAKDRGGSKGSDSSAGPRPQEIDTSRDATPRDLPNRDIGGSTREQPRSASERGTEEPKSDTARGQRQGVSGGESRDERAATTAGRGDGRTERQRPEDREPPSTVSEAFERLFKPAPAAKVAARPMPAAATAGPIPVRPVGSKSYAGSDVLAINLSGTAIEKARQLGFSIAAPSALTHINSTVTRLVAPLGMDAQQARDLLQRDLPAEQFVLNKIYRTYRAAADAAERPAERTEPASQAHTAVPCKGDRCAARELIGWKVHLHSCSRGLRVGVIDTDVDHDHPTFATRKLQMGSFIPEGRLVAPNWHGTGVLAVLAGDPKSGTPGLIPNAELFVASVFFKDDAGGFATDTVSLLKALDWMGAFDVKVVNMSFAGPKDDLVQKAIASLSAKGVVFVAAAGNEGPTAAPSYPAAYSQVIAVTAVNAELRNFPYANRGSHIDVAAPGVGIWTAVPGAKEGSYSGTSFAAPYVTAILATIYRNSQRHQKNDLLTQLEIRDLGTPGRDAIYGRGLLVAPSSCQPDVARPDVATVAQTTAPMPSKPVASDLPWAGSASTASFNR